MTGYDPIRFDFWTGRDFRVAGKELASSPSAELSQIPENPIRRLHENGRVIQKLYLATVAAAEAEEQITPAAEWLIDNNHMVEENLRQLREGMNRAFLRRLPIQNPHFPSKALISLS
ncbi:MAG: hypothetical protein DI616_19835 [Paracoccus denitrificans]|uniref:Uncharacterized protein n=1 Tax=Paracoccus denitrificans TaxID=266 RepID=A0A533HYB0_PARDE|nr:MAG: hypothetical protein DI616_19835 [Paracoccus denitrificans]